MGIKVSDVPNGLAAISKVPSAGWAQIPAYRDFGLEAPTSKDPAEKQEKVGS